jgi:hypothetical protein
MKHDRWLDNLSRLFDGALAGQEKADTEAHLKTCADCEHGVFGQKLASPCRPCDKPT